MKGTVTHAYAQLEADMLHGCINILGSLRRQIEREAAAPDQSEGGTMKCWANVLQAVIRVLDQSAENLDDSVRMDGEGGTNLEA